jgi:hypothetical protein
MKQSVRYYHLAGTGLHGIAVGFSRDNHDGQGQDAEYIDGRISP